MISKNTKFKKITKKANKENRELEFFEKKWFKLLCLFAFMGWLLYMWYPTFQINAKELKEIKVTVSEESKSGGRKDPFKLYFKTKEYSNRFGIYVGGTFGRWREVKETLQPNTVLTLKIYDKNYSKLNNPKEVIPIYYLESDRSLVFDENQFNDGEKSSSNRWLIFIIVVFLAALWSILSD